MSFLIDISDVCNVTDAEKSFQGSLSLKPIEMGDRQIDLPQAVAVAGTVRNVGNGILVSGEIDVKLWLGCSRCLSKYDTDVAVRFKELFLFGDEQKETGRELLSVKGNMIDLGSVIEQLIASEIPFKPLCRSDCAGICAVCGRNKNKFPHDCQEGSIDIRMAKLKDYFKKSQEG